MNVRSTNRGFRYIRHAVLLVLILLLFSFASCSADMGDLSAVPNQSPSMGESENGSILQGEAIKTDNRKIIKTVNETIETEDYDAFLEAMKASVSASDGYISSSSYSGSKESSSSRRASFEIRIPAEGLDAFTGAIGGIGTVTSYNETQQDISIAYVDVQSRIEVLEAERSALLEILAQASYTSEMLEIRAHLEDVQAELASLEAQMRVYNDRIAYSTVHLTVYEVAREVAPIKDTFFAKLGGAFVDSLGGALSFLEGLAIVLLGGSPYFILLGLIGFVIFLSIYLPCRHRAKKREKETKQ